MKKRKLFQMAVTLMMSMCFLLALFGCGVEVECVHEWQNASVLIEATCTTSGRQEQKCTKCNDVQTIEISALGHNSEGTIAHKDETCTEDGVVGGTYCTRCNEGKEEAERVIPSSNHLDENQDHNCDTCGETVSDCADTNKDHNCDTCGTTVSQHTGGTATCQKKATCTICGDEYGQLDLTNHEKDLVWTKTSTTHKHAYKCCGAVTVEEEVHEWEKGVCTECTYVCQHTGGTATCTEKATCTVCGEKYGNTLGHNIVVDTAKGENGYTWSADYASCVAIM